MFARLGVQIKFNLFMLSVPNIAVVTSSTHFPHHLRCSNWRRRLMAGAVSLRKSILCFVQRPEILRQGMSLSSYLRTVYFSVLPLIRLCDFLWSRYYLPAVVCPYFVITFIRQYLFWNVVCRVHIKGIRFNLTQDSHWWLSSHSGDDPHVNVIKSTQHTVVT